MSSKSAVVVLAEGAEEMEFVISVDVLRRAAVNVDVAGLAGLSPVKCSRGVVITPDITLEDASGKSYDVVVLPGGKASNTLAEKVGDVIRKQEKEGRLVAAICAAPIALKSHGVGVGKTLTSYPSVKDQVMEGNKYQYTEDRVFVDGNLITSRGPGTAFEFALAIVDKLVGKEAVEKLKKEMLTNF